MKALLFMRISISIISLSGGKLMKIFVITKKMLIIAAIIVVAVAAAIIIALSFSEGAISPTSAMMQTEEYELEVLAGKKKELPVYSVERSDMKIAITVDAAWEDDKTQFILDTFEEYGVKATFFLCGYWTEKYPDDVKLIAEAGHEIGNHSATHPHMNSISKEQMKKETVDYDDKIEKLTGQRCKLFRAPFGEYNDTVITTMRSLGYEVIQWDIDTIDWKEERSAQTILDTVIPKLHPGCIILCHNNGYKIKEYLPTLIKTAQELGYEFVTVSELLLDGETIIDVNGVQKQKTA